MRLKAIGMSLPVILCAGTVFAAADSRSFASAMFQLTLNGKSMGYVKSVEGGGIKANVVQQAAGAKSLVVDKHISGLEYEPMSATVGFGAPAALYDLIDQSISTSAVRSTFLVTECSPDGKAWAERTALETLITEVGFPAIGGGGKDQAFFTLKLSPEQVQRKEGAGECAPVAGRPKSWLASNFSFELDGVSTDGVSAIEPFTVKLAVKRDTVGESRQAVSEPVKLEIPNVVLMVNRGKSKDFEAWADDFIIKGNNGSDKEKSGAIVYHDGSLKGELGRVTLGHVGIAGLSQSADGAQFKVTLYVESMRLSIGGAKAKEQKAVAAAAKVAPASVVPAKAVKRKASP